MKREILDNLVRYAKLDDLPSVIDEVISLLAWEIAKTLPGCGLRTALDYSVEHLGEIRNLLAYVLKNPAARPLSSARIDINRFLFAAIHRIPEDHPDRDTIASRFVDQRAIPCPEFFIKEEEIGYRPASPENHLQEDGSYFDPISEKFYGIRTEEYHG